MIYTRNPKKIDLLRKARNNKLSKDIILTIYEGNRKATLIMNGKLTSRGESNLMDFDEELKQQKQQELNV